MGQPILNDTPVAKANQVNEFTIKFFANGQYPLVWCDCESAEDFSWSLLEFAWPSLRNWLSIGTFCLQPRPLSEDLFQLMFAPGAARPRFNTLPKQAFIEGKSPEKEPRDSWIAIVAQRLSNPNQPHPLETALAAVGSSIEPDPTLTRNLFLLQDLLTRSKQSPTAGIALLDVLESIAPEPQQSTSFKSEVIATAVESAATLQCDEALKSLFLLNDRFGRNAFSEARSKSTKELRAAVANLAVSALTTALAAVSNRQVLHTSSDYSPFAEGLFDAIEQLSKTDSQKASQLVSLADFREFARDAIVARPEIARGYLRAAHHVGVNGSRLVAGWISDDNLKVDRGQLRRIILPEIRDDQDLPLAQELLRDISTEEVGTALATLFKSTDGFSAVALRETIIEQVALPHSAEVKHWAKVSNQWSFGAGHIAAATYSMDPDGFAELASDWNSEQERSSYLYAGFLDRVLSSQRGAWFRDLARQDCTFLLPLLGLGQTTPTEVHSVIKNVFAQCSEMPIARNLDLLPAINRVSSESDLQIVGTATVMSAIREFVHVNIDEQQLLAWHEPASAANWLRTCSNWELDDFLNRITGNTDNWNRLWQWLVVVPRALYQRSPGGVADIVRTLYLSRCSYWTDTNAKQWSTVLARSRDLSEPSAHLRACAESLHFAFKHTWLPLSAVVVQAFGDVYNSVADRKVVPNEVSCLFGFMDWDKAKELRRTLVDSFYDSNVWRPGDLALAVRNETMLRKVFKRLKRKWHGERFIRAMLDDLTSRNDELSVNASALLNHMISEPDFYEPWD